MSNFAAPPQPVDGAVTRERPILIILHQAHSTPGRLGHMLVERGYRLDVRRPALGDKLPTTMADHAGVMMFGGPMSANDTDAFVKREIDFIDVPLKEEAPFFGICLGAQMLAKAIGGTVGPHPDGQVEIGYYDVTPTEAGAALMDWPKKVYQWHREGFRTPKGTELLVTGHHYEEQAFRVGPCAYGVQFHPELTLAMMYRWTTRASERMKLPGARQRKDHFRGRAIYDPPVKAWLERFLDTWTGAADKRVEALAPETAPALKLSA
ncbi:glutamine amidotransferase [Acuticoccus kandeliae]|uniref:glutamine amidotransferase n=1 Tax=Acuticoccus kandeliae TaxID=2073160 RepID=UPI000D3E3134|nr:glutamine amidotransferase [Acuticoccus kandeliae]